MSMLIVYALAFRPFGTFMEGLINCTIWVTGILASVSYHLFTQGKLPAVANQACTYTVAALTFVVMFAIVVHVMLGVFSRERRNERLARGKRHLAGKAAEIPAILTPDEVLEAVFRHHLPAEETQVFAPPPAPARPPPLPETAKDSSHLAQFKDYFMGLFAPQPDLQKTARADEVARTVNRSWKSCDNDKIELLKLICNVFLFFFFFFFCADQVLIGVAALWRFARRGVAARWRVP